MSSMAKPGVLVSLCAILVALLLFQFGGNGSADQRMGKDFTEPWPPATAGTLEAVENTVWKIPGGKLTFLPGGITHAVPDAHPEQASLGQYNLTSDGLLYMYVKGAPVSGVATWDGERIVLNGEELEALGSSETVVLSSPQLPSARQ